MRLDESGERLTDMERRQPERVRGAALGAAEGKLTSNLEGAARGVEQLVRAVIFAPITGRVHAPEIRSASLQSFLEK